MKKIILALFLISILAIPMIGLTTAPPIPATPAPPVIGVETAVTRILGLLFWAITTIAVIIVFYGAFTILTAAGDAEKMGKGRMIILYAIIGLVVALLARGGVDFVRRVIYPGT